MFENYKLKKYTNNIIGFAYDYDGLFCIRTYLVVNINGEKKYIPYRKIKSSGSGLIINDLEKQGYKNLWSFLDEKDQHKLRLYKK